MREPSCHAVKGKTDYLLWGSLICVVVLYVQALWLDASSDVPNWYFVLVASVFELMNTMWWGMVFGVLFVALLSKVPREFVMSILGTQQGVKGILRATAAGVLLDLCSHGILMVGAKLYERGASVGQVMAFLIASPWNSFSLTLILIALIGLPWTLAFIGFSMLIAVITGILFDCLVRLNKLPANPRQVDLPAGFQFWSAAREGLLNTTYNATFLKSMLFEGIKESRMVMRWLLFSVLLAALIRAFVSPEVFGLYFGPTLAGLGLTVLVATLLEICSEGSTPIAADLVTRGKAPGNGFAFLMTGVTTDYTEMLVIKEMTRSWRITVLLPVLTVPQVLLVAWLMNVV